MRAREANALDPVDGVACAKQLAELRAQLRREVSPPRVDVLAEQRDLTHPLLCEARHLRDDLARPAALLPPPDGRNDAVRALRVAAHRDLHPCLVAALAVHRQLAGERAVVEPETPARDPASAGTEPLAEMRDRAGAERHVDLRVQLEEPLPLRLRVAAADRDHRVRVRALLRERVADVRREARVGLLADRARVEHEHVSALWRRRLAEAELFEHPLDAL